MSTYKVGRKVSTKEIEIISNALAFTSGFTSIGTFDHDDLVTGANDSDDDLDDGLLLNTSTPITAPAQLDEGSHVLFHHVRDLLYKAGELDFSKYSILIRTLTAFTVTPTTTTKAPAATQQITIASVTPVNALDQAFTYSSSNTAKATVNASGLITAVATGSATITVTHPKTGIKRTVAVTVS
jgi:uncharacterized protein YjdB